MFRQQTVFLSLFSDSDEGFTDFTAGRHMQQSLPVQSNVGNAL